MPGGELHSNSKALVISTFTKEHGVRARKAGTLSQYILGERILYPTLTKSVSARVMDISGDLEVVCLECRLALFPANSRTQNTAV